MKRSLLFLFIAILTLIFSSCAGDDPAAMPEENPEPGVYDPVVHTLENIDIGEAATLVLRKVEIDPDTNQSRNTSQSAFQRCDELGALKGAVYEKIPLQGNQTPCFKNVHFWDGEPDIIYGQYQPLDASSDVWFITDAAGKVHHLPRAPKKDRGFKNDKLIRKYQGKPVYLTQDDFLAGFDMTADKEEIILETRVGRFVVIPKNNGEHIVYTDLAGGKIKRPDGSVDNISGVNLSRSFYKNKSDDLQYLTGWEFLNITFDATGNILEKQATAIPVELNEWIINGLIGSPYPRGPNPPSWGLEDCERDDDFMLCGVRGFLLADSSQDIREIDWQELGISGANPETCLTDSFIYYAAGDALHKISRDFSASEPVLEGFNIYALQCLDDENLIIHGLNTVSSQYETFQLTFQSAGNIRTMISENIARFIR